LAPFFFVLGLNNNVDGGQISSCLTWARAHAKFLFYRMLLSQNRFPLLRNMLKVFVLSHFLHANRYPLRSKMLSRKE
jgi:hypothetical protein